MLQKKSQSGQMLIALIVGVLLVGSYFLAGGINYKKPKPIKSGTDIYSSSDIEIKAPSSKKTNIQLDPLNFCQRVPGDTPQCYPKNAGYCCPNNNWAIVQCKNGKCAGVEKTGGGPFVEVFAEKAGMTPCEWMKNPVNYPGGGHAGYPVDEWCASDSCKNIPDGFLCWGKPVILLYPEVPTLVNVEIVTSGEIYISDPLYPVGGWKNVLANPSGSLIYEDKNYEELFYESKVKNYGTPKEGLVFKTEELGAKLSRLLYDLGLNNSKNEIPEFMDFWLPKLKALDSKYILVSLIEKEIKDKNDKVVISPAPETRIEIIVYFKALEKPIELPALQIGTRPVRQGFTMVEWGGTIDSSNQ